MFNLVFLQSTAFSSNSNCNPLLASIGHPDFCLPKYDMIWLREKDVQRIVYSSSEGRRHEYCVHEQLYLERERKSLPPPSLMIMLEGYAWSMEGSILHSSGGKWLYDHLPFLWFVLSLQWLAFNWGNHIWEVSLGLENSAPMPD